MQKNLKNVVLFTRSLNIGGAERQLCELAKFLSSHGVSVTVITYYAGGKFEHVIREIDGVNYFSLNSKNAFHSLFLSPKVGFYCRKQKVNLLYCFIGSEPGYWTKLISKTKVITSIRGGVIDFNLNDRKTFWLLKLGSLLSRKVDLIIANSSAGKNFYKSIGFPENKIIVHFNGFDVARFVPNSSARNNFRKTFGFTEDAFVIGYFARYHPEKGHKFLLESLTMIGESGKDWRVILAGGGDLTYKSSLVSYASELNLEKRIIWLDDSFDVVYLYSGLDLAVMPSSPSEGFPNFLGEAMLMSLPSVSTRVGDAVEMLGSENFTVDYGDAHALEKLIGQFMSMSSLERKSIGLSNRERIELNYSVSEYGRRCIDIFNELVTLDDKD